MHTNNYFNKEQSKSPFFKDLTYDMPRGVLKLAELRMGSCMFSPGLDRETRLVTYTAVYLGAEETLGKLSDSVALQKEQG